MLPIEQRMYLAYTRMLGPVRPATGEPILSWADLGDGREWWVQTASDNAHLGEAKLIQVLAAQGAMDRGRLTEAAARHWVEVSDDLFVDPDAVVLALEALLDHVTG